MKYRLYPSCLSHFPPYVDNKDGDVGRATDCIKIPFEELGKKIAQALPAN